MATLAELTAKFESLPKYDGPSGHCLVDRETLSHTVISVFMALATAMGEDKLHRAIDNLLDIMRDESRLTRQARDILESIVGGIEWVDSHGPDHRMPQ